MTRADRRIEERGRDPQRDQHADVARIAKRELRRVNGADRGDAEQRGADERDQRERALQKQVGERERKILVQDGERERQRRVVASSSTGHDASP